ncbi:MAG: transporter [Deltaproteobacteria bacterium]|nr:transporter [Deltaproteobacteria bacterium]
MAFVSRSYAIDLQPGEIRAPKPGMNIIQASYFLSERGDLYVDKEKQPGNPEIVAQQFLLRYGRSFEIFGHPGVTYVQSSTGYVHPGGSLSKYEGDSGFGDTTLAFGVWPYANQDTKSYVAVAAYLTVPTGSYSHERLFNMGENRYRPALQVGFHAPFIGGLEWMGALDAVWYQTNPDYGSQRKNLAQDALYSGQLGFMYNVTSAFSAAATYFYSAGGETSLDGVGRNDDLRQNRYMLTGIAKFPFGRVTLQYGGDITTRNGFFEKYKLIVRYTKVF